MIVKEIRYSQLFDIYAPLLTEKQREIFESYYSFDLSLSEIAEQNGVTRQSVADSLKKTKAELDGFENSLSIAAKFADIRSLAESVGGEVGERLMKILEK